MQGVVIAPRAQSGAEPTQTWFEHVWPPPHAPQLKVAVHLSLIVVLHAFCSAQVVGTHGSPGPMYATLPLQPALSNNHARNWA
jgi:hypothetical protein